MRISARRMLLLLLGTSVLIAGPAFAVKKSRLWLPRAQHELQSQLIQAAQLVESSDECEEVISGELDTDRSAEGAPVFRVVCRNPAGYTYSVYVTNAGKPDAKVEKVQSEAATAENNAARKLSASSADNARAGDKSVDDKTGSKNCLEALKRRTGHMAGVKLDESNLQRLALPTGDAQYELDFDAADPSGIALHFHAVCRVSAGGTALVEIRPRRAASVESASKPQTQPKSQTIEQDAVATDNQSKSAVSAPASTSQPRKDEPASKADDTDKAGLTDDEGWEVVE